MSTGGAAGGGGKLRLADCGNVGSRLGWNARRSGNRAGRGRRNLRQVRGHASLAGVSLPQRWAKKKRQNENKRGSNEVCTICGDNLFFHLESSSFNLLTARDLKKQMQCGICCEVIFVARRMSSLFFFKNPRSAVAGLQLSIWPRYFTGIRICEWIVLFEVAGCSISTLNVLPPNQ